MLGLALTPRRAHNYEKRSVVVIVRYNNALFFSPPIAAYLIALQR